jgi:hypothetical protein
MQIDPFKRVAKKSWTTDKKTDPSVPVVKKEKFDFEKMKAAATSDDRQVRKEAFIEYFERFNEFPSYLFDNERQVDPRLAETIQDISKDENVTKGLLDGIQALLQRLPW